MVSQQDIDTILSRNDIVDVISEYISLDRKGNEYQSSCPFLDHDDKDPSFKVSPRKNLFYCFGCKRGGTAINFLMEYNRMSFIEALKWLGQRAGITVKQEQYSDLLDKLRVLYSQAQKLAESGLDNVSQANNYYTQRGLSTETIKEYRLGFCDGSWYEKFSKEHEALTLEESGLFVNGTDFSTYDKFGDKFIMPFRDTLGHVVGFAGTKKGADPKYQNTRDTKFFLKKEFLFGLYEAQQYIKEKDCVLIVEGYFDCMSLYQYGFKNVIATCGTALTSGHVKLLSRFTKSAMLLFDGDSAGQKAIDFAFVTLFEAGFDVYVVPLPEGKDPDDILKEDGHRRLIDCLHESTDWFSFRLPADSDLSTAELNSQINRVKNLADQFDTDETRLLFLELAAQHFGIDVERLYLKKSYTTKKQKRPLPQLMLGHLNEMVLLAGLVKAPMREDITEALFHPDIQWLYHQVLQAKGVEANLYNGLDRRAAEIVGHLLFMSNNGVDVNVVLRAVRKEHVGRLIQLLIRDITESERLNKDCTELQEQLDKLLRAKEKLG